MSPEPIPPRLRWACRRGMLELDLWLDRFLNEAWPNLNQDDRKIFEIMLEEPDPVLYRWLTQQEIPSNPVVCLIINQIRQHVRR